MNYLIFPSLGLGNGGVYAALAIGLVLTFRSSGVLNFATGAMAMYGAYVYSYLRSGQYLVPIPGLPTTIDLGFTPPVPAALAIASCTVALFGIVLYLGVFRALRSKPPMTRAVASIGVMVAVQAALALRVGQNPVSVAPIFPQGQLTIDGVGIPQDRLYFAGAILVLAISLWLIMRFTTFGIATRAAAESEKGAVVTGLSPNRLAIANWAISGAVVALAGSFIAPIVPLVPDSYTLFIVPALAAALFGAFDRILLATFAGFMIGAIQAELTYLIARFPSIPPGLNQVVPLAIIVVVLVARGNSLPIRGALIERNLGEAPRPKAIGWPAAVASLAAIAGLLLLHGPERGALIASMIFSIIALSLVLITGYLGQVSLVQFELSGIGGLMVCYLATDWGVPFPVAPILAALTAALIGVVVGLPALRIRGLSFAVVTLAMAVAIDAFWFGNSHLNGGSNGAHISGPNLFGWNLGIGHGRQYPSIAFGILCLVILVAVACGVSQLRRSRFGSQMVAVRANERSAAAAGINVVTTKVTVFALAAFIAGLGGAMLSYDQMTVSATSYTAIGGLALFTTVYLAGITTVSGGLLAGILSASGVFVVVLERYVNVASWYTLVAGVVLALAMKRHPEGIAGTVRRLLSKRDEAKTGGAAPVVGPPPEVLAGEYVSTRTGDDLAGVPVAAPLLVVENLTVRYGEVMAVSDVSFEVPAGRIVGLIGPNGAGKTTLIDALSGFVPASGRISFDGHNIEDEPPYRRARLGLVRTFQQAELCDDLTTRENITIGEAAATSIDRTSRGRISKSDREMRRTADTRLLGLDDVIEKRAELLSQGHRKLAAVARALAGRPRMLLLDEPAAGLDSTESVWLGERIQEIRGRGVTVMLIDHDMNLMMGVCDEIHVLDFGRVIASGTPDEVRRNPDVDVAYLGSGFGRGESNGRISSQKMFPTILDVKGVAAGYGQTAVLRDFDLQLGAGEVVALLGPNGAGKTTALLTLAGLLQPISGRLHLDGKDFPVRRPVELCRSGLVLVPDDRALFSSLTVRENLELAAGRHSTAISDVFGYFPTLQARGEMRAGSLSGGEQQMLALARGLVQRPRILLVDEMSMGLAPRIVETLLMVLRRIADETGAGIVLVEQHVQLALEVADRGLVLVHGETRLEGSAEELWCGKATLQSLYLGDTVSSGSSAASGKLGADGDGA